MGAPATAFAAGLSIAKPVPMVAIESYCNVNGITLQEWFNDRKHVRAMLNDPDLRDFRIWPGRV